MPARPEEVGRSKESGVLNDMIAEINAPILARLFDKESAQDGQAKPNPVAAIKPPTLPGATTQGITPAMGKLGSAAPANPPKSLLSRLLKAADTQTSAPTGSNTGSSNIQNKGIGTGGSLTGSGASRHSGGGSASTTAAVLRTPRLPRAAPLSMPSRRDARSVAPPMKSMLRWPWARSWVTHP